MHTTLKIKILQRVLNDAKDIEGLSADDIKFKAWHNATFLAIIKVFESDSHEFYSFRDTHFTKHSNSSEVNREVYDHDLQLTVSAIKGYLADLEDEAGLETDVSLSLPTAANNSKKVFISHASADKEIVGEIIEILRLIGLQHDQIFCTSFEDYGIPLGVNYLDWLKAEISDNALVMFVLSRNFYKSAVCLAEMGATWVLSKNHVPLLVPPLTYDEVKGVVPLTQGMKVNEKLKFNELARLVDKQFGLTTGRSSDWERSRDKVISRIDSHIQVAITAEKVAAEAIEKERLRPWSELRKIIDDTKA